MGARVVHPEPTQPRSPLASYTGEVNGVEAIQQANQVLDAYVNAEVSEPVFVLNGFRNQLAWMIQVLSEGEFVNRVFVTPGYVYQRKVGETPRLPGWRGSDERKKDHK